MRRLTTAVLLLVLLGAAGIWLVDYVAVPFVWVALVALGYCGWSFRRTTATIGKVLWLNLGVVVLVLGLVETGLWIAAPPPAVFDPALPQSAGNISHDDYGYAPAPSSRTRAVKLAGARPLYDVVYTIDQYGLRVSPPELDPQHRRGCVLFFGCSNTFGEGVQDDETLPWQVGVATGGRFAVRNLGFSGWGPHQMLAALQAGDVERAAGCEVTHVVYLALYWHARRVSGRVPWDRNGPRFVLDGAGHAVRAGHFSDGDLHWRLPRPLLERLRKSLLYQKYLLTLFDPFERPTEPDEIDLLAAIVAGARDEVSVRFPHAAFDVLFWDISLPPNWVASFTKRLAARDLTVHPLSRAIPDYRSPFDPRYVISAVDQHPSPAAYARIADYVVHDILHEAGR